MLFGGFIEHGGLRILEVLRQADLVFQCVILYLAVLVPDNLGTLVQV